MFTHLLHIVYVCVKKNLGWEIVSVVYFLSFAFL